MALSKEFMDSFNSNVSKRAQQRTVIPQTDERQRLINLQNDVSQKLGITLTGEPTSEEDIQQRATAAIQEYNNRPKPQAAKPGSNLPPTKYEAVPGPTLHEQFVSSIKNPPVFEGSGVGLAPSIRAQAQTGQGANRLPDIDQKLAQAGLPSAQELSNMNINPEFAANNPTATRLMMKLPRSGESLLPGKAGQFEQRFGLSGSHISGMGGVPEPEVMPTTGNKILDTTADLLGGIGGFMTAAATGGPAGLALSAGKIAAGSGPVARTIAKGAQALGPLTKPLENAISRAAGRSGTMGKMAQAASNVLSNLPGIAMNRATHTAGAGIGGGILGGMQAATAGGSPEEIAKAGLEEAAMFMLYDNTFAAGSFILKGLGKAASVKVRGALAGKKIEPYEVKAEYQSRTPDQFAKEGYEEFRPGSGLWIKRDLKTGGVIDQQYVIENVAGTQVPTFELWRAERKKGTPLSMEERAVVAREFQAKQEVNARRGPVQEAEAPAQAQQQPARQPEKKQKPQEQQEAQKSVEAKQPQEAQQQPQQPGLKVEVNVNGKWRLAEVRQAGIDKKGFAYYEVIVQGDKMPRRVYLSPEKVRDIAEQTAQETAQQPQAPQPQAPTTGTQLEQPTAEQPGVVQGQQEEAQQPTHKYQPGDIVTDPNGKRLTVIADGDRSLVRVRNEKGAEYQIGRKAIKPAPAEVGQVEAGMVEEVKPAEQQQPETPTQEQHPETKLYHDLDSTRKEMVRGTAESMRQTDTESNRLANIHDQIRERGGIKIGKGDAYYTEYIEGVPGNVRAQISRANGMSLDQVADEMGMSARELLDELRNPKNTSTKGDRETSLVEDYLDKAEQHLAQNDADYKDIIRTMGELRDKWGDVLGPEAEPSLTRGAEQQQQPAAQQPSTATPGRKVANWAFNKIEAGEKFSQNDLLNAAADAYGGTLAKNKFTRKDAYDSMELGINLYLLKHKLHIGPSTSTLVATRTLKSIEDKILSLIPTQTVRTEEHDEFQQFSTPPNLAYIAGWVANPTNKDVVLEPSAGIGGLAVFPKALGATVYVNELSSRRAEFLREMGFDRVFTENAEHLNNILPKDVQPTLVIMNPPFSSTAGRMQGARANKNVIPHIEQALKRLQPGGRLVAIVGRGMSEDAATFRDWWKTIKQEYNVRANIGIDGKNYTKYGTQFDVRLLVIDKTGPTEGTTLTGDIANLEEVLPLLEGIKNDRAAISTSGPAEQATGKPTGQGTSQESQAEPGSKPAVSVPANPVGDAGREGGNAGSNQPKRNDGSVVGSGAPDVSVEPGKGNVPTNEGGARSGKPASNVGRPGGTIQTENAGERGGVSGGETNVRTTGDGTVEPDGRRDGLESAQGEPATPVKQEKTDIKIESQEAKKDTGDLTDAVFTEYTPQKLKIPGAKQHPGNLAQSAAMAAVEPPTPTYTPNLPKEVIEEGKLSIAQLEPIVYAGQAHEQFLPDGQRKGFFDGDGTGVGKGRIISGIIMDNMRQGRKKAVWISKNAVLFEDANRDFGDIGGDTNLLFDLSKYKPGMQIKQSQGILFTTYDTLAQGLSSSVSGEVVTREGKQARIDQIMDWLGKDFEGAVIFDEAHMMQNSQASKGKRGVKKPAVRALAGLEFQKRIPNGRISYFSATGATEVASLGYADRLGLWGKGTSFASKTDFINKTQAGGLAAMELVARDMKAMGAYIARNLSFDGVTYGTMEHTLSPEQTEIFDEMAGGWQIVLQNLYKALETTGQNGDGNAKGRAVSQFWGAEQRFFNQVLTSMQMPSAITQAKKDLADGNSVVMQLVNTNEAAQNRQIAKMDEEDSLEDLDLTPREALMQYIDKSFPIQQYEEYMDENDNVRSRPVFDSHGNPVINQEALRMKEELMAKLGAMKVPEGPLELVLNAFGAENVAEVTGRTRRIVKVTGEDGRPKAVVENRTPKHSAADAAAFMEGRKRILIFSDAGGTGRSYHASLTAKNQQRRIHYLIQAGWKADSAVQGFGRTHRTNQANAPHYVLVTTNLKGQKRFISSIARRLDQLGALTKGQRQTGSQGLFSAKDNLESDMARDALQRFYEDLTRNQVPGLNANDILPKMGMAGLLTEGKSLKEAPETREITKFLNRILALKSSEQNRVFDAFSERLDNLVDQAIANGTLDVGLENYKADKVKNVEEKTVYTDEKSGAETKYIALDASHKNKKVSFDKVARLSTLKGFYKNERSGRIYGFARSGHTTLESGSVVINYRQLGQTEGMTGYVTEPELRQGNWKELSIEEARTLWDEAMEKVPEYRVERLHLISGALLPIWDRLPQDRVRVIRIRTGDGQTLLGRLINERAIDITLKRLGADRAKQQLGPQEYVDKILNEGATIYLSNEWRIMRRRVSGETRIEIMGKNLYPYTKELQSEGVFTERIQYETRFFIPTGEKAAEVFGNVVKYRPIVDVVAPEGQAAQQQPQSLANSSLRDRVDQSLSNRVTQNPSLQEVQQSLSEEVDEAVGDVDIPMGQSVKDVGKKGKPTAAPQHSPQKTSLNQIAAGLRFAVSNGIFTKGMLIADVGGGRYDKGIEFLNSHGITGLVYDPYAKTKEHDDYVLSRIEANGGADGVALNNVLNTIPTGKERADVLKFSYEILKPGSKAVITVHVGNKSGKGAQREFTDGTSTWQENRATATYEEEIKVAFPPDAIIERKGPAYIVTKKAAGKTGESIREVEQSLGEEVDEAVGDVGIPVGQSVSFNWPGKRKSGTGIPPEKVLKGVGTPPDRKSQKDKEPEFAFSDPETEQRYLAAHGAKTPGFWPKMKEFMDSLYRKSTREFEWLPHGPEFTPLRDDLLKLAKQKGVASDKTLRLQQGITIAFRDNPDVFELFERKVIIDDLMEELKLEHDLPFGFTPELLEADAKRLNAHLQKYPDISTAIEKRNRVWGAIKHDYIRYMKDIGFDVSDRFNKENYFRHQILEYVNAKGLTGTGKKLKSPTGRGFLKERGGSEMDINTSYLEAEYEVMAQMLYDIQVARVIKAVEDNYSIYKKLKAQAKRLNTDRVNEVIQKELDVAEPSPTEEAMKKFKQRIAMGFSGLQKLAEDGELWDGDGRFARVVEDLAADDGARVPGAFGDPHEDAEPTNKLFRYLSELVYQQEAGSRDAATILKAASSRRRFIKNLLGDKFATVENILPEGYTLWQPREGNLFFYANSVPEQMAEQLFTGALDELNLKQGDLKQVMVMGPKRKQFVVKEEVALTLDNLLKDKPNNPVANAFRKMLSSWKVYTLVSPPRWFKYNFRNISGDADAAFVGNPTTFLKVPQAVTELYRVFKGDAAMTPTMRDWFEEGGMQTLLQVQEMGDVNNLRMFEQMVKAHGTWKETPIKLWQGWWKSARMSTDFREAILRYAAYLDYLEQMQKNDGSPKNFGASNPEEIMALKDIKGRAFWLSNDLLGAYDKVSVTGQWLREYIAPFWSWKEVNFRRYVRLIRNAAAGGTLPEAMGRSLLAGLRKTPMIAIKVGIFALRASALWAMLQVWNNTKFPEEEAGLPEDIRSRPHLIFGRDGEGKARYISRLGAVGDFLGWFGLDTPQALVADWLNGKKTIKEVAVEMAKAPVNILWQAIGPQFKIPTELASGKKTFPDVFNPSNIRNKMLYLAQSFDLGEEYSQIAGLPSKGYWERIKGVFAEGQDIGQGAYYDTLDEKRAFLKKIDKESSYGGTTTKKSQALYNVKLSIRYKDQKALDKYLIEYANLGGTAKGLKQSLSSMDPLYGLNKEEKQVFISDWLDDEGKRRLLDAYDFYESVLMGKGDGGDQEE